MRYSRLLRYAELKDNLPRWQQASAAVVGLGGLGGGIARQLARLGIRQLILVDRDIANEENLGHQSLITEEHVRQGLPKAYAAAEVLKSINSDVECVAKCTDLTRLNIKDVLSGAGLIFDGLDNYFTRFLLNDYALSGGVPYFYAGVVRGELSARAVVPGVTGCLRCLLPEPPAAGEVPTCAAEGVFPPLLGVANALQLWAANRYLSGKFGVEDDVLYSLDVKDWRMVQLELSGSQADCPACGNAAYDGGAAHLHGIVRTGFHAGNGGVIGRARLAAGAARRQSTDGADRVARRRFDFDSARDRLGIPAAEPNLVNLVIS